MEDSSYINVINMNNKFQIVDSDKKHNEENLLNPSKNVA
jgi:hypothetical protein